MYNKYLLSGIIALFVVLTLLMLPILLNNTEKNVVDIDKHPLVEESAKTAGVAQDDFNSVAVSPVVSNGVVKVTDKPQISRVTFSAVGDNILHTSVLSDAKNLAVGTDKEYNFIPMFSDIIPYIKNADLAYINQESPFAGKERGYSGYPMFNSPDQMGEDLIEMGFDIINLANNHMLDKRASGYQSTIDYWKTKPDVTYIGGYENKEDYENIRIVEKNGIKIGFLAFTYGTNGIPLDSGSDMIIPLCDDYADDEIDRMTKKAREMCDILIVSMHWGHEHWFTPSNLQERQLDILVKNNVDVVLGSHPHTLQPMFWRTRDDGKRTLVVYSLSNILSGMEYMRNMLGGVCTFELVKIGDSAFVTNPCFVPTLCHFNSSVRGFKIYKYSDYTQELLKKHGTQVRGTDVSRDMEYLDKILSNTIDDEFLKEPDYLNIEE